MKAIIIVCLALFAGAARAYWDVAPFLEPHVKTPLYGRYAGMSPATDPRMNKDLQKILTDLGLGGVAPAFSYGSDWESAKKGAAKVMAGIDGLFEAVAGAQEQFTADRKDIFIKGVDGNQIPLSIYQGTSKTCYYLTHGGGMAVLSARDKLYTTQLNKMAAYHGMTVVAVEFRNYLHHPDPTLELAQFPAGLNDSFSGLEWLHEHKAELGCETVVNYGESGGGNLCLALGLKMVKEGRTELTDGSYCFCPYIFNDVFSQRTPSMSENAGYFLDLLNEDTQTFANLYTADPADRTNPLAWPINAKTEDMKGMKPVFIVVNELDPLRDAGMEMYRKLQHAGVPSQMKVLGGTIHAGESWVGGTVMETEVNGMKAFAASLRGKILVEADAPAKEAEVKAK